MANKIPEDDKALFREAMVGVLPLESPLKCTDKKPIAPIKRKRAMPVEVTLPEFYLSEPYDFSVTANSPINFTRPGLPHQRLNELKKGMISWQARLDLHRLNTTQAKAHFIRFINKAITDKHRSLLIIHGKGGYDGAAPILKNMVNHWLPQIPEVLAFTSALPKHGGVGALYVLLKRFIEP